MVYPENLSSGNLVDEHMSSMDFDGDDTDSEMEWEEENVDQGNKPSDDPCFNDVQILYNVLYCFSELSRGGSRIFRTSVKKKFGQGVVSAGRGGR